MPRPTRPLSWFELITKHKATTSAAPNFAFDLAVRKVPAEARDQLDLSSLRIVVNGAEPVRARTMARFERYFAPAGLSKKALTPSFGMAATTCRM